VSNRANNVYAGKDGNIYRQQGSSWQQRGKNSWTDADFPSRGTSDRQGVGSGQGAGANRPSTADRDFGTSLGSSNRAGTMDRGGYGGNAASLNRDAAARSRGTANTNSFNRGGSYGGSRGSYGGSRGGGRGGGGRRR
jgi:hypothetical protein